MRWGLPIYLNFILLVPILTAFFIFVSFRRKKILERFGDRALLERLSSARSAAKERARRILILSAVCFLIIALALPQIGARLTMSKRKGVDVLIVIDTSLSMTAQDIKPNRIEKAKLEVDSFIDKLKGDRVGILTFSGNSFVQCPLTLDYNAAKMILSIVQPGMMPKPGTAIGDAIRTASGAFIKKQRKYKVLVLLTDGEDHDTNPLDAAKDAKKQGIIIYTIGIGTQKGEPIPIVDESSGVIGYKKDNNGEVVMSKLDFTTLQKIALITDGKYYNASPGEFELDKIYDEITKMEKKELSGRLWTQYEERFQYFLGIALILLCVEFVIGDRRKQCQMSKYILLIALFVNIGWIWEKDAVQKDKKARKLYEEGDISGALSKWRAAQIENPDKEELHYNIGNALHKEKEYEDSYKEYENALSSKDDVFKAKAYYNMGNTNYRMGKLEDAIKDYEQCIKLTPDDEDAKYNIEFTKKRLEQKTRDEGEQKAEQEKQESRDVQEQEQNKQQLQQEKAIELQPKEDKEQGEEKAPDSREKEKEGEMSKEDAIRLLDALKDDEKDLQKQLRTRHMENGYKVEKDW